MPRLLAQYLGEHGIVAAIDADDGRRRGAVDIVLHQKSRHDFIERRALRVLWKERAVSDVTAASYHDHVHGGEPLIGDGGNDVDVAGGRAFHELARLQLLQARDLVAQPRRALERERRGGLLHLSLQERQHLVGLALQKKRRVPDILLIFGLRDQAHARTRAALDLIEHAGPRAVDEDAVLAGAQLKDFLQQRHPFAHRTRAREGSEIAMRLVELAAMEA